MDPEPEEAVVMGTYRGPTRLVERSQLSLGKVVMAAPISREWVGLQQFPAATQSSLQDLLDKLKEETLDVMVPEIEEMRFAHYVTTGSECTASLSKYLDKLKRSEIGWHVRVPELATTPMCCHQERMSFSSRAYLNSIELLLMCCCQSVDQDS